ncbi:TetR/AcrR family transcriptional regulator [Nocardia cyriacigeorgica]|uniref:TetR/AcrR family transcriptional regulator n=1 Tax=Nocardia cyriacigeorgica TaxID=135487 RepID=UPI0018945287|nr:TetR/AcrR family transcriptional regulator [Nocardia cyriacigeorgica]MBF6089898.1 TetR/AcrR family transcriptional regulator [Nocardia cyriacigeorgica]MBF6095142.1 TetR/AcrR family transcriptional regulator [Nocardia cyriacigeorgica]MBF6101059.1 TetR/AcrR family transcriptional regulator [Nocardia cyriacigeorgica]MBF6398951.1 TetR/AcrR family transcriptional regulator [Nocardia cyriacigeorgica]MBF6404582.1 TetR/AcrR family transcriptional regulator [Nocardia cyriacigeorgica]
MTTAATSRDDLDSIESRILDAALVQFADVGIKKTTIEDIARKAGVDRVTVYRRIGSRDDVVRAVALREVNAVLTELEDVAARNDTLADLVADIFVTVVTRWREHPLVRRMLTAEPDRLLPQLTTEGGAAFTVSTAAGVAALRQAVERGLLADSPDLSTRVEIACRIVHSLILQPVGSIPLDTDDQLREFARKYLVPIVSG